MAQMPRAQMPIDIGDSGVVRVFGPRSGGIVLAAVTAMALGLGLAIVLPARDGARAQSRSGQPTITIAPVIAAAPTSETLLPIRISPADAIPRQSFLRIRGLPRTVSLSEGYSIAPGAWAVPLAALPRLRLSTPAGAEGKSEVTISLVSSDGIVLSEARCTLLISAARPDTTTRGPRPSGAALLKVVPLPPEVRERAVKLLDKGNQLIATKDFSAAQHFYKRAAEMGLAEAALALARRYDPDELARHGAVGTQGDRELARKWYEKARELGSPEADDALRRMTSR